MSSGSKLASCWAVALLLAIGDAAGAGSEGIQIHTGTFAVDSADRKAQAWYVAVPRKEADMRVLYVPALSVRKGREDSVGFQRMLSSDVYAKSRKENRIVLAGGFSSYRKDLPVGLLVEDGRLKSSLNASKSKLTEKCKGELGTKEEYAFRYSGVICRKKGGGGIAILPTGDVNVESCDEALQAGPMLVEPGGRLGICEGEEDLRPPFERTVVCIDQSDMLNLIVTERTHLRPLAEWLVKPANKGGLGCIVALNLAGAEYAGMIVQRLSDRRSREFPPNDSNRSAPHVSGLLFTIR